MSRTKRLFIAIGTSDLIGPQFTPILKKLKINADQKEMSVKWVPNDNYHVTLSFLGEHPSDKIPELSSCIRSIVESIPSFSLKIDDMSAFPTESSGRVIYVGVQAKRILQFLKTSIDDALKEKGLISWAADERGFFIPHLTIGRLRNPQHVKDFLSPFKRKSFGKIEVREVILYESVLNGSYPVYIPVQKFSLAKSESIILAENISY